MMGHHFQQSILMSLFFDWIFGLSVKEAKRVSDHYPVYGGFYINRDSD